MEGLIATLFFIFFVAFLLSMFSPRLVIRWGSEKTRKKAFIYFGVPFLILGISIGLLGKSGEIKEGPIVEIQAEKKEISPKGSSQFDTSAIDNLSEEEKNLIKKYHIEIDRIIAPKVNPLWVRERVMESIKNDFDRNFLESIDLSIFSAPGENYTFAQFKQDYTYTDSKTGKSRKGKRVYRSFNVFNDGKVQEKGGVSTDGVRVVYHELNSIERDKAIAYSSELYDKMYKENRFNKQEWERLSDVDYKKRLETQKQEYIRMVQEFEKNIKK